MVIIRCSSNVLHTLMSSNDLAHRLGVSRATVLCAGARGRLNAALFTLGGHRRFAVSEIEAPRRAQLGEGVRT
jgi:hypothetical protein